MSRKRFSKKLYIYLAFVTMAAVSLLARPIKKFRARPKKRKPNLRVLLGLEQPASSFKKNKKRNR